MASEFPLEVESVLGAEEREGAPPPARAGQGLSLVCIWDPLLLMDTAL